MNRNPERAGGVGRRPVFTGVALAIPMLFFVLAEAGLRLGGYGREFPLFIAHPQHPDYLLANPDVLKRYFPDPAGAPSMQIETMFFRAKKPAGTVRIFVQGGSSAAGFPYGIGASIAGMLEQRLRREYPHRDIEVVNTAMSAVNSYTLLDFADEIVAQSPDAVLIYAGHNEYLGIFGVGSAFLGGHAHWATRAYLALRDVRLFQLLQAGWQRIAPPRPAVLNAAQSGGTMMSRVAAEKSIPMGSPMYRRGEAQFSGNLRSLLQRYRSAGIPVYIGTPVANEADQPPFNSGVSAGTSGDEWRQRYDRVRAQLDEGVSPVTAARELVRFDDGSAAAHYLLGRAALAGGDVPQARASYRRARDLDRLRFRAPTAFSAIVTAVAAGTGATVVPVESRMRAGSAHGIPGSGLFLEHVHPNLDGYFVMADAFFDALVTDRLLGVPVVALDDDHARREVPLSDVDVAFGAYKVALIKANWPFTDRPGRPELPEATNLPERLAQQLYRQTIDWPRAHLRLLEHYQSVGDQERVTQTALILADAFPFRAASQYQAGTALIGAGRATQARNYLARAVRLQPNDVNALLALAHAQVLEGAHAPAADLLARVLELEPGNATAQRVLRQLGR